MAPPRQRAQPPPACARDCRRHALPSRGSAPPAPRWVLIGSWRRQGRVPGRRDSQWAASPVSVRRVLVRAEGARTQHGGVPHPSVPRGRLRGRARGLRHRHERVRAGAVPARAAAALGAAGAGLHLLPAAGQRPLPPLARPGSHPAPGAGPAPPGLGLEHLHRPLPRRRPPGHRRRLRRKRRRPFLGGGGGRAGGGDGGRAPGGRRRPRRAGAEEDVGEEGLPGAGHRHGVGPHRPGLRAAARLPGRGAQHADGATRGSCPLRALGLPPPPPLRPAHGLRPPGQLHRHHLPLRPARRSLSPATRTRLLLFAVSGGHRGGLCVSRPSHFPAPLRAAGPRGVLSQGACGTAARGVGTLVPREHRALPGGFFSTGGGGGDGFPA